MLAYSLLAALAAISAVATPVDTATLESRQINTAGKSGIIPGIECSKYPAQQLGVSAGLLQSPSSWTISDGTTIHSEIGVKYFLTWWTFPPSGQGPIKMVAGGNGPDKDVTKCIDAGSNPANGVQLKIWECYDGLPQQQWKITEDRIELIGYNLCFDLKDGNITENIYQTWQCYDGNPNQMFYLV